MAAPLTVRIIDGRLLLCAPTEERLAGAAADAGVDLSTLGTVAVLLDDGSTGQWYGAPVVGALAARALDCYDTAAGDGLGASDATMLPAHWLRKGAR